MYLLSFFRTRDNMGVMAAQSIPCSRNVNEDLNMNTHVASHIPHERASILLTQEHLMQNESTNLQPNIDSCYNDDLPVRPNDQLYVTILNENRESQQLVNQDATGGSYNQVIQHSTSSDDCEQSDQMDSPLNESDSNFDLSSNASTVLDNTCTNTAIPAVNLIPADPSGGAATSSSNQESQILVDVSGDGVSPEARALGGATGLNVHHPDYVSASDDDSISCGRSSPPPSYAEVAREDGFAPA